ncbi:SSI family serine proteinase inhibitor [Streptomyces sp. NBC_00557]|uniref:SSI family serine proteinase inhibitor n=1 Tax=Streptomyces sp. NBC_00557 TaxID=2975776 RepID=UPI002E80D2D7|nr:SSI family serine proteinase inhibitor [Streptomyces sp. NBC_00557]WUC35970.1 subtilase-type protease inhibitor [Streptomyces sp. NBC_00557]
MRGRRTPVLAAVSGLVGLAAAPAVASPAVAVPAAGAARAVPAVAVPGMPPPVRPEDRAGDHLTVVVRHAGAGRDGTYELFCHPAGGTHPDAVEACRVLDAQTNWGRDLFAPVAPGTACTMLYGGPATAHVTGTWAGRRVDAAYDRSNGCETGRWDRMVPLLPKAGAAEREEWGRRGSRGPEGWRRGRAAGEP